jgi:hypothetical protein
MGGRNRWTICDGIGGPSSDIPSEVAVAHGGGFIKDDGVLVAPCPTFHPGSGASSAAMTAAVTPSDDLSKHYNKEIGEFSRHCHRFLVLLCFCDLWMILVDLAMSFLSCSWRDGASNMF